jgi:hypothetical protein
VRYCTVADAHLNEPVRSGQNLRNVDASARPGICFDQPLPRNQDQFMDSQNALHQPQQIEVRIDVDA